MARPLAPREMWARGNHLSDAESALPGVGGSPTHQSAELAPVPSRQGGHSPIEAGASVSADQLLQATQAKGPPPPLPLGQIGPASVSPLSIPCPQAISASGIKSRPHLHSRPSGPHQLLHPLPRRPQSPPCSLMSAAHTQTTGHLHMLFSLSPDALPCHLPPSHCCSQPSSKASSLRQYRGRVRNVLGAVQGSHGSPNHPNPS